MLRGCTVCKTIFGCVTELDIRKECVGCKVQCLYREQRVDYLQMPLITSGICDPCMKDYRQHLTDYRRHLGQVSNQLQ